MQAPAGETHLDKQEARAGTGPRAMRYVLMISVALAIIAMSAIWMTGALSAPENDGQADTATAGTAG
ncbi:hypothetical protein [Novosphingobium colocasiae]|uniref:hypothetical protein n=1 Tax=Novosphingobium colocasiae TaxID=1256513 RepID=UPI0035B39071